MKSGQSGLYETNIILTPIDVSDRLVDVKLTPRQTVMRAETLKPRATEISELSMSNCHRSVLHYYSLCESDLRLKQPNRVASKFSDRRSSDL